MTRMRRHRARVLAAAPLSLLIGLALMTLPMSAPRAEANAAGVPANASADSYGSGWRCGRGYRATEDACAPVVLPPNVHLDYSGSDRECDRPFRKQAESCVLP